MPNKELKYCEYFFNLIGHAFSVKEAAKDTWYSLAGDLNNDVVDARAAVMKAAGIKEDKVMRDILPLHPMAALVLKNIASAFQSNQRSMFDFTIQRKLCLQSLLHFLQSSL